MADEENKKESKGRGQPAGKGFDALVEFMGENNRATSEIEKDQRNTRRHLLEMKKLDIGAVELQERMNSNFENFFETMNAGKLDTQEADSERLAIFQEIRDGINNQSAASAAGAEKAGKSTMKGMGKLLGGAGIGVGAAGLGIAAVIGAGAFMLDKLESMDAQKISDNVGILSKMGSDNENFLKDGGKVAIVLTGLGIGLAAFGLGSGVASAVDHFQKDGWAQKIADNVEILTGIADMKFADTAEVVATLTGLGIGLAAFGIGSSVAGVSEAVNKFASGEDWPQTIVDNVKTLLSIADLQTGDATTVMATLAQLGGGLAVFGVGSFFANASGDGQGEQIRTEVESLLKIAEDPNADPAKAELAKQALKTLGGGLTGFGVGSFFAKAAGDGSGEKIRQEVSSLLAIAEDPNSSEEDILRATAALGALGAGLAAFGAGSFVGSLAGAASAVLDFFSGAESPIEQAKDLGNNAELVKTGVTALTQFREELNRFGSMGSVSGDLGLTEMADDLLSASKLINLAVAGGTDFRGRNTDYIGLANVEGVDEAISQITKLKEALGLVSPTVGVEMSQTSSENAEASTSGETNNAVVSNTNTQEGATSNQIIMHAPSKINRIDSVLATR
jgi:hypothetical protein